MKKHFLLRAHENMSANLKGHLWLPKSSAWRWYINISESSIRKAKRNGYLTKDNGIPQLTRLGYRSF